LQRALHDLALLPDARELLVQGVRRLQQEQCVLESDPAQEPTTSAAVTATTTRAAAWSAATTRATALAAAEPTGVSTARETAVAAAVVNADVTAASAA
jgi:hypothetical protein